MLGQVELKKELVRAMNDQDFDYVEGIDEVELFVNDFILTNGYTVTEFIVESIDGFKRHLRIFCIRNDETKFSVYIEITVNEFQ